MGLCLQISAYVYYYLPSFLPPVTHKLLCMPYSQAASLSIQRSILHLKRSAIIQWSGAPRAHARHVAKVHNTNLLFLCSERK